MMASGRTWIVVLDDSRAQFFRRETSGALVEAAPELSSGNGEQPAQSRRTARDGILRDAMVATEAACDRNECDRIVVVGPERLLGAFRRQASDRVRVRLWRERAGEVSTLSADDIAQSIDAYFR